MITHTLYDIYVHWFMFNKQKYITECKHEDMTFEEFQSAMFTKFIQEQNIPIEYEKN